MTLRVNYPDSQKQDRLVSKEQIVRDMVGMIRRETWSRSQIESLYQAVVSKLVSKTCSKCLKVKPELDGTFIYPDGDMSKPKRFLCVDCKGLP
jgi:hypothetical protein